MLHYATSRDLATWVTSGCKSANKLRGDFVSNGYLIHHYIDEEQPRLPTDREPVFGFAHGFVKSQSGSVLYSMGTTQTPAVNYRTAADEVELQPWWATKVCYGEVNIIKAHYREYRTTQDEAAIWETRLKSDIASYYSGQAAGHTYTIQMTSSGAD